MAALLFAALCRYMRTLGSVCERASFQRYGGDCACRHVLRAAHDRNSRAVPPLIEPLGVHNPRIDRVRALAQKKGRRDQQRYTFEGLTLIGEALRSNVPIEEIYATRDVLENDPSLTRAFAQRNIPIFTVDERTMKKLSDLQTPPGMLAVAPIAMAALAQIFSSDGIVLVLAGLSDPGNAGTLVRTAEAFGLRGVIFGTNSVEPHSPKVMRAAMGSLFRVPVAVAGPQEVKAATPGWQVTGLAPGGTPIGELPWGIRDVVVVGHERHGLADWRPLCARTAAIPMRGQVESLNAAMAGAIALYEASKTLGNRLVKRV